MDVLAEQYAIVTEKLNLWYGDFQALFDVDLSIRSGAITSLIGPSGCGKSTYLRCINRINERLGYVRTTGRVSVMGHDVYAPEVELIQVRKNIGMVFQRPNPLPLTIRENVLFGHRLHHPERLSKSDEDDLLQDALQTVCGMKSKTSFTSRRLDSVWSPSKSCASRACFP
jgi:phosphate transport system ATP-binding protein